MDADDDHLPNHHGHEDQDRLNQNKVNPPDDLYAILGVERTASPDDVKAAYRQRSRMFHPDKHSNLDSDLQRDAVSVFNRIKKAHDILTDEHLRVVYDNHGLEGVETILSETPDSLRQVILRSKTPKEIQEEFEEIQRQKEDRRLQQQSNPKGSIIVGINATDLFDQLSTYGYDVEEDDDELEEENVESVGLIPRVEVRQLSILQSIDVPFSRTESATLRGNLTTSNGKGHGNFATTYRRIISHKAWAEVEFMIGQGPVFVIKGFRNLNDAKTFVTGHVMLPIVIQPGYGGTSVTVAPLFEGTIGRNFSQRFVGYLTGRVGVRNAIVASFVFNQSINHVFNMSIQAGLRESFLAVSYVRKLEVNETRVKIASKIGTKGVNVEYGIETKASPKSSVGAFMVVGIPSGVTLRVKFSYGGQSFMFDILLHDEVIPSAIFYGTVMPIVAYGLVKKLAVDYYLERESRKDLQEAKKKELDRLAKSRQESAAILSLWKETYEKVVSKERETNGLVILAAIYGESRQVAELMNRLKDDETVNYSDVVDVIDVKMSLQCQVRDGVLRLPAVCKANLLGFFDPAIHQEKRLYVKYILKGETRDVILDDMEGITIPAN